MSAKKLNFTPDNLNSLSLPDKFKGNIIPHEWYKHFSNSSQIFTLSEILYKTKLKAKSGESLKFKFDYKETARKLNLSMYQVKEAIRNLEKRNLLQKQVINNKVYISPNIEAISLISGGDCLTAPGNLIPHKWFKNILSKCGGASSVAILILGEILYWNRNGKDNNSLYGKKLYEEWQTNYAYLKKKFQICQETVRRALVELEELEVIERRTQVHESMSIVNKTLTIYLNIERLLEITEEKIEKRPELVNNNLLHTTPQNIDPHIIELEYSKKNIDLELNFNNEKIEKVEKAPLRKGLENYLPLTEEETDKIAEEANRDFTHVAINKLAKHLSGKYKNNLFMNRRCVINYLVIAVANERRETTKLNKTSFRFMSEAVNKEVEIERVLNSIEDSRCPSFDTKVKKRIMSYFEPNEAYELIEGAYFPDIRYLNEGGDYKVKFYNKVPKLLNLLPKIKIILESCMEESGKLPKIVFESTSRARPQEATSTPVIDNVVEFKRPKSLTEFMPLSSASLDKMKAVTGKDFTKEHEMTDWFFKLRANFVFESEESLVNQLIKGMEGVQ